MTDDFNDNGSIFFLTFFLGGSLLQALLALPQLFSPRLQRLVHRGVSFAAPAARVRKAGDDCLEAMLTRQEEELGGLADGLEGFASLDGVGAIR